MIGADTQRVTQSAGGEGGKIAPKHKYRFLLKAVGGQRQDLRVLKFAIGSDTSDHGFDADVGWHQTSQVHSRAHGYGGAGGNSINPDSKVDEFHIRPLFGNLPVPSDMFAGKRETVAANAFIT